MHKTEPARLIIAFAFTASAVIVTLSPIHHPYSQRAWGVVGLGAFLGVFVGWLRHRSTTGFPTISIGQLAILLAILSQIASATSQAIIAIVLPPNYLTIDSTPGLIYILMVSAVLLAFTTVFLLWWSGDKGLVWAALLSAGFFSSTIFISSFAVLEAGPIYGSIIALMLAAWVASINSASAALPNKIGWPARFPRQWFSSARFWWSAYLLAVAVSNLFSPVPGKSWGFWVQVGTMGILASLMSRSLMRRKDWYHTAWVILVIAGILPVLFGAIKLASLLGTFDWSTTLGFRWHPIEMGGANFITRSIICVVPLGMALLHKSSKTSHQGKYYGELAMLVWLAATFIIMLFSRSWVGLIGWFAAVFTYLIFIQWEKISALWLSWRISEYLKKPFLVLGVVAVLVFLLQTFNLASRLNVYSFNGRLYHFRSAVLAWLNHPIVGGGAANDSILTSTTFFRNYFVNNQTTLDDPLLSIQTLTSLLVGPSLNNFLEVGAGTGILGILGFLGFLAVLFRNGWKSIRNASSEGKFFLAACLAGIAGELAWGMLEVLGVTPLFFSFPVWALIGLLWAGQRLSQTEAPAIPSASVPRKFARSGYATGMIVLAAILFVLVPSLASYYHARGYVAFQERRWANAADAFTQAGWFAPLDAHLQEMLAKSHLEQLDFERATNAYLRASRLKADFAPYRNQLGWLMWLGGDRAGAKKYFQQAVDLDPGEAWQAGLHADLGLTYAAEGNYEQAIALFAQSIEFYPQVSSANYWIQGPISTSGGPQTDQIEVFLDPAYLNSEDPEFKQRVYAHLGLSNYGNRQFIPTLSVESPVSLSTVLDEIYTNYQSDPDQNTILRLAGYAEASRRAGLVERAALAYQEYQDRQPKSAFGFRELSKLYGQQGNSEMEQLLLSKALEASPNDIATLFHSAQIQMKQAQWQQAEKSLDAIQAVGRATPFRSRLYQVEFYVLRAQLFESQNRLEEADRFWRQAIYIQGTPEIHLARANNLFARNQGAVALQECRAAQDAALRSWAHPLDPILWQIAQCANRVDSEADFSKEITFPTEKFPFIGQILTGHWQRATGKLDLALTAYQSASSAKADDPAPHIYMGDTYRDLGRLEAAEMEYQLAAELDSKESIPMISSGNMAWTQGQTLLAVDRFRSAVEMTPGWDVAHIHLGNALLALDEAVNAGEQYRLAWLAQDNQLDNIHYDFVSRLAEAEIEAAGPQFVQNDFYTIDHERLRVIFMHPDSKAAYKLSVSARDTLTFAIGMSPDSWSQAGDGVEFIVKLHSNSGEETVFTQTIDPKNDPSDRRWHNYSIDLTPYAGQDIQIQFETNAGPAGDNQFDWAGWGNPRIIAPLSP